MASYEAAFETECGMEFATIEASSLEDATRILKSIFKNDHGADGFWTDHEGNETPIEW